MGGAGQEAGQWPDLGAGLAGALRERTAARPPALPGRACREGSRGSEGGLGGAGWPEGLQWKDKRPALLTALQDRAAEATLSIHVAQRYSGQN